MHSIELENIDIPIQISSGKYISKPFNLITSSSCQTILCKNNKC